MQLDIPWKLENFIGGEFKAPSRGHYLDNINPATGEKSGLIPDSTAEDIEDAVVASRKAFTSWAVTPSEERFRVLNRIADLIDENLQILAQAETNDNGKPLWLSKKVDIPRASANFRFFATGI